MNSDQIFIIGRQRSGTTVFRELLKNEGAFDCDEIFHGVISRPHRFYRYVLERIAKQPALVHPQSHPALFWDYVKHLRSIAKGAPLAMDVKYFGLNVIPTREDVDGRGPFLFNYMVESGARVVHVVRQNKLRILVSEELSKATGLWSVSREEDKLTEKKPLTINPKAALTFIDAQLNQQKRVAVQLNRVSDLEAIEYESMFDGDVFSEHTLQVARRFMAKQDIDPRPRNIRMNPEPIAQLVENFDELAAALRGTPHEWMLTAD